MTMRTRRHERLVLAVVGLALMTVVSAVSGLNVALPDLARATHASQSQVQWIVDSYTMVFAGLLLSAGAVGDRYGRRPILIVGLVIFGGAALGAVFATDPTVLIMLRGTMGVGAACVMPATLSIITSSFPVDRRAQAVGVWVGIAGAGAVVGLLASGILLNFFSWNSFFTLNVALAVLAVIGAVTVIPNSVDEAPTRARAFPDRSPPQLTGSATAGTGLTAARFRPSFPDGASPRCGWAVADRTLGHSGLRTGAR